VASRPYVVVHVKSLIRLSTGGILLEWLVSRPRVPDFELSSNKNPAQHVAQTLPVGSELAEDDVIIQCCSRM
jgi:hypothetical protein